MHKFLILPIFAMVLVTFGVAMLMLRARIQAVRSGKVKLDHFRTFSEGTPTEAMLKTSQHFTNLFELPVLFYAAALAGLALPASGWAIHIWAWLFVGSRIVHARIHISHNRILLRMRAYQFSWLCVLAMWTILAWQVLQA